MLQDDCNDLNAVGETFGKCSSTCVWFLKLLVKKLKSNIKVNTHRGQMQGNSKHNQQQSPGKKALKTHKIKDILVLFCRYTVEALGYDVENKCKKYPTECYISVCFLK